MQKKDAEMKLYTCSRYRYLSLCVAWVLALLPLVLGCGASPADKPRAAAAEPDGAALYKKYCIACHGAAGDMGMNGAANLQQSQLSLEARIEVIREGRNMMTPFEGLLTEAEIEAVARYTMEFSEAE